MQDKLVLRARGQAKAGRWSREGMTDSQEGAVSNPWANSLGSVSSCEIHDDQPNQLGSSKKHKGINAHKVYKGQPYRKGRVDSTLSVAEFLVSFNKYI